MENPVHGELEGLAGQRSRWSEALAAPEAVRKLRLVNERLMALFVSLLAVQDDPVELKRRLLEAHRARRPRGV